MEGNTTLDSLPTEGIEFTTGEEVGTETQTLVKTTVESEENSDYVACISLSLIGLRLLISYHRSFLGWRLTLCMLPLQDNPSLLSETNISSPGPDDLPIQHEQSYKRRKIVCGCVGFLLKPNEDAHHQSCTHSIIHLEERRQ